MCRVKGETARRPPDQKQCGSKQCGAPACLHTKAVTSGRRWDERGLWRTIVLMWRLRLLYWLGVPAERLAAAYR